MLAKINKMILFLFHFEEKNVGGPVKQVKKVWPKRASFYSVPPGCYIYWYPVSLSHHQQNLPDFKTDHVS